MPYLAEQRIFDCLIPLSTVCLQIKEVHLENLLEYGNLEILREIVPIQLLELQLQLNEKAQVEQHHVHKLQRQNFLLFAL